MDHASMALQIIQARALDNRWMSNCQKISSGVQTLIDWCPSPIGETYEEGWVFNEEAWRDDNKAKELLERLLRPVRRSERR